MNTAKKNRLYTAVLSVLLCCPYLWPERPAKTHGIEGERLKRHVEFLAGIQPPRNSRHPDSLDRAAAYICKELGRWSDRVEIQVYEVGDGTFKNVAASFGPETGAGIVVGAHYDVWGEGPGADDNGSGVAALLELARMLHRPGSRLKRPIVLAAYTLEEPPLFGTPRMGSAVHAESLKKEGVAVKVMISLDMIGYFAPDAGKKTLLTSFIKPASIVPGRSTTVVGKRGQERLSAKIGQYIEAGSGAITAVVINPPADARGVDYSDHKSFWEQGWDAVMITNFYVNPNPYYHKPKDTVDRLDFSKLGLLVRGIYRALVEL